MYAKIKSNNKILINRLDDTEKILLKDILEDSKNKEIKFEQVISDDGEFGGIFINLEDKEEEVITEEPTTEPTTIEPTTEPTTEPVEDETQG